MRESWWWVWSKHHQTKKWGKSGVDGRIVAMSHFAKGAKRRWKGQEEPVTNSPDQSNLGYIIKAV